MFGKLKPLLMTAAVVLGVIFLVFKINPGGIRSKVAGM